VNIIIIVILGWLKLKLFYVLILQQSSQLDCIYTVAVNAVQANKH